MVRYRAVGLPGLTPVESGWQIQITIALSASAMQQSAVPRPPEHTNVEIEAGATDAGAQDAAAVTAAAALAALHSEIAPAVAAACQ